ncbi:MAG: peptidase MA family metallohydrolase [Chloroflexota bacterium]|nr:peptidase MA family metallohydrolase [Chloroflexota bacterium]
MSAKPAIIAALAALSLATLAACAQPDATPTPTTAPAPIPTLAPPTPPQPTPTSASPQPTPQGLVFTRNQAAPSLPGSITFSAALTSETPIETLDVEFGRETVFSCASASYTSARTGIEPGRNVEAEWTWDMRRTGSIPPGSTVWWRWRTVDAEGRERRSERRELEYEDDRFRWQSHTAGNITYYWYAGGDGFGRKLAGAVNANLGNLQLGRELVKPIKAFVYESAADVQGAILFAQQWAGGLAFGADNVLLITVDPAAFDLHLPGVTHELAHLLVAEVTFNCFGDLPTWVDEGLAVYAEGVLPNAQRRALNQAVAQDALISLRSLNSSFPAGHTGAILSYAQSYSLIAYLLDAYGWSKMQQLLAVYAEGAAYEDAIRRVYGFGLDGLEAEWRASLGLE